jgi:outer membrane protein OmpA-like peptidoglycan-associated protein
MAEDALEEAGRQAAACPASAEPPQPAVAPLPALPSAPAVVVVAETITLRAGALFRFDGGAASDLLVEGRAQLDELASNLAKTYLTIESITLVGHADRLGNADYNLRLSRQRAETVKEYLGARGIAAPMVARGVGASRPLVACNADRSTGALKSCLQANRRVEIVVRGVRR